MQRLLTLLIILSLFCSCLSGCAEFQDKPLKPVETVARIEARSLSSQPFKDFFETVRGPQSVWPCPAWGLDLLTLAAVFYHPDMELSRAQADTAKAGIITAGQRPNPLINATPTWIRNPVTPGLPFIALTYLSIPIETAGKRDYRIDKAEHLSQAARLRIGDTAWLLRGRLRLALLEFYAAQETESLLHRQLAIQQQMLNSLEQQLQAGEITRFDLSRSQLALNQLQLKNNAAAKRTAESRALLAAAIGIPVEALSDLAFDFDKLAHPPDLAGIPVQNLKQLALQNRPDILAALADYAAAQSALQLEIANQYPNIQANPGYTWDMGDHRWSLGATMLLPVFNQNQGPIAEADAKRRELAVRFEALQTRIIADIARAHAGVAAVEEKRRTTEKQIRLQQANRQSAQALFEAGEIDRLTLLLTDFDATLSERAQLDMLIESQQALNSLEDSLRYPLASQLPGTLVSESVLRKPSP